MSSSHVIRALYNLSYETFEITGPQMVLTMKLSTFAWNVWDGRRPVGVWVQQIIKYDTYATSSIQELDKWQSEKRVTKYPSLLEFLGFSWVYLEVPHAAPY